MIAFIAFSALLTIASAQYPYQQNQQGYQQPPPQQYQPQPQQYQPQPQQYQPQPQQYQPQPQQYQPQPQPQAARTHIPAAVHYVNIGAELAGDYKFGYDTGKGNDGQSFREETRLPDGSVQGAYGYVDETGKQYQPQPQPQAARTHIPAAVHYVNIGAELAGDYKFGYDTGKGNDGQSFREETRLPDGSVQGAYGYVDETGKQRVIKYTAGKNGFQVEGDGIPKAPAAPAPAQAAPANPGYNAYNGNPNHQGRY